MKKAGCCLAIIASMFSFGGLVAILLLAAVFGGGVSSSPAAEPDDGELVGNKNEEKAYNFFIKKGLTDYQSAGIVGNFIAESGVRPEALNSIGCIGIAQWCFGRADRLKSKPNYDTLEVQLDFVWTEFTGPYKTRVLVPLLATTNVRDATEVILRKYEIPCTGDRECQPYLEKRVKFAEGVLEKYGGN